MTRLELHQDYGSLVGSGLADLRAKLSREAASGRNGPLVLELSNVTFAGAGFIGLLIEVASGLRSQGRRMALVNTVPAIRALFSVTQTENWFADVL